MGMAKTGLEIPVMDGAGKTNKDNLMDVMTSIRDVKKNMEVTTEMFQPLRNCITLLMEHGVDVNDTKVKGPKPELDVGAQDYLEDAPMHWDAVVKKMVTTKESILPLQVCCLSTQSQDLSGTA